MSTLLLFVFCLCQKCDNNPACRLIWWFVLFPSCFLICSYPSLPHLASSLLSPHLFLIMSLVSVYLVSVFPSLPVQSLFVFACSCSCSCSCSWSSWFLVSDVWYELWFFFVLCLAFTLRLCLAVLGATLPFAPVLSAFGFCIRLLLNKSLPFVPRDPCLPV